MASHLVKKEEGGGDWWESLDNLVAVRDYAILNGLLLRTSSDDTDDSCIQVPFTLTPSLFPVELFKLAQSVQRDLNEMVDAVSRDHEFITQVLGNVIKVDDFTRNIYQIYTEIHHNNRQTCAVGMHRSDYMVDCLPSPSTDKAEDSLCLRQIELNTIAVGSFGLNSQLKDLHEYVESRYALPRPYHYELPVNQSMERMSDTLACAWKTYGKTSTYLLMVVCVAERNVYGQKTVEFGLWKKYKVRTIRRTLTQLVQDASLGKDRELIVSGMEVAVVYYRSGYSPDAYPTEKEWAARRLMEMSRASSCPSTAYQLVGTKKVQQALAEPGALERFVKDPEAVARIRSTFAGLYSLDMTPAGDAALHMALKKPEQFVVKPQREGGGNNYFGKDVHTLLQQICSSQQREAYILMDMIHPRRQNGLIFREHMFQIQEVPVIGELGIFGGFVRCGDKILYNTEAGFVLRTKGAESTEGGMCIGQGALDTPALVSSGEFVRLTTPDIH